MIVASCNRPYKKQIYLSQPQSIHLTNLSSASGISIHNQIIYVVGDDTPWLYKLDNNFNIKSTTQISAINTLFNDRVPKQLKADFECAEIISDGNSHEIVIISSGSSLHTRDTAYIISISDIGKSYVKNLRPLFENIKSKSNLPETNEINIEGLAFSTDYAYLLHRGNVSENMVIEINRDDFLAYVKQNGSLPEFIIYKFNLPTYKGISSGFSGACISPDSLNLIFTASMEDTKDEINDGTVVGSFVGVIPFSGMSKGEYQASLLLDNGIRMKKKLEGIAVVSLFANRETINNTNIFDVITVCDNDDGTSDIITFNIEMH